ncbi:MAG: DNRLRE domain-containing protein [Candidatus Thiodiazotropha taylori]|nr:DNRLRE domain-containing protein [Candidatus Thiodiazotropha taylori]
MPKHSFRLVILACVGAFFIFSYSDVIACPEGRTVIFFTNGILTPKDDAESARLELERKLQGVLSDQAFRCLEFEVSYNATRLPEGEVTYLERLYNGSLDTAQALGQNVTTFSQRFWATLAGIEAAPDWLQEEFLRNAASVNRAAIYLAPEILAHQQRYEDVIRNEGKNVLAVGHSQGNFYANQTYFLMPEDIKQFMGIVSVATFDSFVAGQEQPYKYTNLVEDLALDAAIALASTIPGIGAIGCTGGTDIPLDGIELLNMWPLCPNITNVEVSGDWKGHNFITAYLVKDSNSENRILVDILDTLNGVQDPNPTTSNKFNIGDTIEVISDLVNIKDSPPGIIIGSVNIGVTGIVIEGPELWESSWWWQIDFDNDPDGWVAEEYLLGTTVSPNTNEISVSRDIWTTSIYGYDTENHFSGCGGGRNDESLRVGGWGDYYYSLLLFDLSGIHATVSSATLRMYNTVDLNNTSQTVSMHLDRVTGDWNWTTNPIGTCTLDNERLWWADRPSYAPYVSSLPAPGRPAFWEVDVTDLVNSYITGIYENYGIQLRPTAISNNFNVFASSEHPNESWRPKLILELE